MTVVMTAAAVSALLGAAVVGGIFFAFSNFVMKALHRLPAGESIAAMQSINVVVLNRGFLGVFAGTAALCLLLAGFAVTRWQDPASPWLLGGAVAYVAGTWLLTIAGNVPLNERLAKLGRDEPESAVFWEHYVDRWTRLNSLRALAAVSAALLIITGLVL